MAEKLIIQSIVTDNRITAQFSDKFLPRYARQGELFVVDGILYIYADLTDSDRGRWFPLSNEKEIYTYETKSASDIWTIPVDFQTDNIQVIIYDQNDKVYGKDFTISVDEMTVTISFLEEVSGQAYIIINKAFDWVDRRFIVADRKFAVTEDKNNPNDYYLELDTKYFEVLKNGNTTLRRDLTVNGSLLVDGATTFNGNQTLGGNVAIGGNLSVQGTITSINHLIAEANTTVKGNLYVNGETIIDGNLTVKGTTTSINTEEIKLDDNIITLNANAVDIPTQNAGIEVQRGLEGVTTIIQWDEANDVTNIPNNTVINGSLQVDGDTNIDGNLTINGQSGSRVDINTSTLTVEDNIVTLNKGISGIPTKNVGIEADRGDEGILPIITFDETDDKIIIPVKQQNGTFLQDEVAGKKWTTSEIDSEVTRATNAESMLQSNIDTEKARAISVESNITTLLQTTNTELQSNLDSEVTRATNAESMLQSNIDTEKARAISVENTNTLAIDTETTNRTIAISILQSNLDSEVTRATNVENNVNSTITMEISDRETADNILQNQLDNITSIMSTDSERLSAIQTLTTAFTNADNDLNNTITILGTTLQTNLDSLSISTTNSINIIKSTTYNKTEVLELFRILLKMVNSLNESSDQDIDNIINTLLTTV